MALFSKSESDFFGFELMYRNVESTLRSKTDVVVLFTHFALAKHGDFLCIGVGDDKAQDEALDLSGSEILPDGWNADTSKYALRYIKNGEVYQLLALRCNKCLVLNLLNEDLRAVSIIALEPEQLVKNLNGGIYDLIPDAELLMQRLCKKFIAPVIIMTSDANKEATTQTNAARMRLNMSRGRPKQFRPIASGSNNINNELSSMRENDGIISPDGPTSTNRRRRSVNSADSDGELPEEPATPTQEPPPPNSGHHNDYFS